MRASLPVYTSNRIQTRVIQYLKIWYISMQKFDKRLQLRQKLKKNRPLLTWVSVSHFQDVWAEQFFAILHPHDSTLTHIPWQTELFYTFHLLSFPNNSIFILFLSQWKAALQRRISMSARFKFWNTPYVSSSRAIETFLITSTTRKMPISLAENSLPFEYPPYL